MSKIQERRNNILRMIKHPHRVNCIRLHNNSSMEHQQRLAEICIQAKQKGMQFVTEAKLKSGGRADIIILDLGLVVEVTHSEQEHQTIKKDYPLPVVTSPTNQEFQFKQLL